MSILKLIDEIKDNVNNLSETQIKLFEHLKPILHEHHIKNESASKSPSKDIVDISLLEDLLLHILNDIKVISLRNEEIHQRISL